MKITAALTVIAAAMSVATASRPAPPSVHKRQLSELESFAESAETELQTISEGFSALVDVAEALTSSTVAAEIATDAAAVTSALNDAIEALEVIVALLQEV